MVVPRASARWTSRFFGRSNCTAKKPNRTYSWHQVQRRTYASEGGQKSHQKSGLSGDIPWAIGSLVVTIPSVWYLAQPQIERLSGKKGGHGDHGHGDGGHGDPDEDHGDESEGNAKEGEEDSEETASASGTASGEGAGSGDSAEENDGDVGSESTDSEEGGQDTPDTSDEEGSENVAHEVDSGSNTEGVQFKGATSGGSGEGEQGDTRKHIPDAKGGNKKRIESDYGNKQGEAQNPEQDPNNEDMAATAKPAGNKTTQSGKQEGLSNTDTKHSTDIANSPEKSTKPTGGPETAKEKGTVDPNRPQS